ncbi:MAG TPA: TlyA family RNA methyltransferase [Acidobacteriaceae bacterium]|nr:TlyA family RNA methyltransferase [Acidobacteriaceae bacterium]
MKLRLDKLLVGQGLASSRTRAQQRISAGQISVDGAIVTKSGLLVDSKQLIQAIEDDIPFVSRGGVKLAAALDAWKIAVAGRNCLDIGISTGGFSDCLLQRGAMRVVGVDSGHGQLAEKLRSDSRLLLLEHTNARHLTANMLPCEIEFFTVDVSFIAASLILPAAIAAAFPSKSQDSSREAVILVKPQFEAGKEFVGKGGIVASSAAHQRAVERVRQTLNAHGALETRVMDSPILGGDGNREFLMYARF